MLYLVRGSPVGAGESVHPSSPIITHPLSSLIPHPSPSTHLTSPHPSHSGIAELAKESIAKGLGAPKVHLSFSLDGSGVVSLSKAEATYELPPEPEPEPELGQEEEKKEEGEKVEEKKVEGEGEKVEGEGEKKEEKKEGEEGKEGEEKKEKDVKDKKAEKKKKDKKKKPKKQEREVRRTLLVSENHRAISPPSWPPLAIAEARGRLRALQAIDESRQAREAALNDLEGYIYKVSGG